MAQCKADGRKHPTMDMYVGIFNSKLYSSNRGNVKLNSTSNGYTKPKEASSGLTRQLNDVAGTKRASDEHGPVTEKKTSMFADDNGKRTLLNENVHSQKTQYVSDGEAQMSNGGSHVHNNKNMFAWSSLHKPNGHIDQISLKMNGNDYGLYANHVNHDVEYMKKANHDVEYMKKSNHDVEHMKKADQDVFHADKMCNTDAGFDPNSIHISKNSVASIDMETSARRSPEHDQPHGKKLPDASSDMPKVKKNSGELQLHTDGKRSSAELMTNVAGKSSVSDQGMALMRSSSTKNQSSGELSRSGYSSDRSQKSLDLVTNRQKSGEMNPTTKTWNSESVSNKSMEQSARVFQRAGLYNSGSLDSKSGEQDKGVTQRGNLFTSVSLDSSSSQGGSSNGGSPTAADANRANGKVSSFGNILCNKGSPSSTGSKSGNQVTASAKSSGEILPTRKSGEIVQGNPRRTSSDGSLGNIRNHGSGGSNGSNLMVGGGNGNVWSLSAAPPTGGVKSNANANNAADWTLIRRVQATNDAEEIARVGNEFYKRLQFSEALALYDKAVALCPNNAFYRSNRAATLNSLDRLGEAVQEYEEALLVDPAFARAHHRVGSIYLRLGLTDRANQHFQAAGLCNDSIDVQCLQNIQRHIYKCMEARKQGNWHNVIRESDAAVVAGADAAMQIFGYKSEALLRIHKPEEADTVSMAAQKIQSSLVKSSVLPEDTFLHIIRAQVDITLGRFERAVAESEIAVKIDSKSSQAALMLRKAEAVANARKVGNDKFKAGRYFEALAVYAEGLEYDPMNAILLCNRAACRLKLGQWEKAIEDCDAALRIQPNYTKALMRRANCWMKLERWEEALQDYEILRREMPGDIEVARGFFDVQVAMKKSRGEETHKMKFGGDVEEVSTNEQFQEAVSSPGLSVVEFIARWNERCRQLSPFVDDLCKRHPCVNFVKVDVEENPYIAKMESVGFIPTFKIYRNGQKVKEILGPTEQLLEYTVKQFSM